jgi:hypothetical protein
MGYEHEINKAGKDAFALKPKKADFVKQLQTHIRSLHEAPGRGAAGGLGMEIPLTDEDVAEWRKHASSRAIASQLFAPNAEDDHLYTSDTPISKALPKPHILVTDRRGLKHNGIDFYSYFPETEQLIFKKTTARGD